MPKFHRLIKTHYDRWMKGRGRPLGVWGRRFLRAVSDSFWERDKDQQLLERSMDASAREATRRNAQIRAIFQTFPDLFFLVNAQGVIVEATGDGLVDGGPVPGLWLGKPLAEFPTPEIGRRFAAAMDRARKTKAAASLEYALLTAGGLAFYEARLRLTEDDQMITVVRDITGRKAALEALQSSEERYALAAQAANDGLWDWNLPTNRIYFSPRWKALLGYGDAELPNETASWWDRIHPDDLGSVKGELTDLGRKSKNALEIEYRIRHRDNSYRWVLTRGIAVRDAGGAVFRFVGSQTDITPQKSAEEQLRHEAFHDRTTGLANRSLFLDRLSNVLDRVKRQPGYLLAVVYVDLDRFSGINERLGHEAADRLLATVAARLRSFARAGDTVARLGDDEYAILLDGIANERAAMVFADRMSELISAPCDVGPEEVTITASMGITINTPENASPEMLLNEAESAMQRAKQAGKNRRELFDRETFTRLVSKLKIETELRHAAEKGELVLYYQPIFRIPDTKIVRMEALIRWNHPQRGMVSPLEFIPVAEETGLILNIGDWVLQEVAEQARRWSKGGADPVAIAVNFSPRQFQQQDLLISIGATLAKFKSSGFPLELEITEGAAMQDVDQSVKILRSLREMGVRISMDDFGVGYSSLSCLRLFPLNTLKIDRGFVQGIPKMKDNTAITNAIIGIGHSLGLSLVAEGVETEEQLAFLKEKGCEEAQGFLLGRPMPAKDIALLLK